jgi:hypothetical protein
MTMKACDHVVASHGAHLVRASAWTDYALRFAGAVSFFNSTPLAVPHPGFVTPHRFCSDCGERLDAQQVDADIRQVLGTAAAPSAFDRDSYVQWLLSPTTP